MGKRMKYKKKPKSTLRKVLVNGWWEKELNKWKEKNPSKRKVWVNGWWTKESIFRKKKWI